MNKSFANKNKPNKAFFKKTILAFSPPILTRSFIVLKRMLQRSSAEKLFDGDEDLFKQSFSNTKVYAEYGCGASTVWVFKNEECDILCVDSSEVWLSHVRQQCGDSKKLHLHFANVGQIGEWGTPINYENYNGFHDYTDWIWSQSQSPDLVLIDGRFRVCCFLTSILRAKEGARILFDDYTNRPEYHIVERFVKPVSTCGRQALFIVPNSRDLNLQELQSFIEHFRFVFN
jgi:hypothetical protein